MSPRAFDGSLEQKNIRIGGQRLLLAAMGTPAITSKITDITNPPAGWRNLGSLNEHNLEVTGTQELFRIMDGIPEAPKYMERVGLSGVAKGVLNEWSFMNLWEVLGRPPIAHTFGTASDVVSGTPTKSTVTVADGTKFAVKDVIAIAQSGSIASTPNTTVITAINGNILTFDPLSTAPIASDLVKNVLWSLTSWGDNGELVNLQAACVFDSKDGTQIINHLPQCIMTSEYNPALNKIKQNIVLAIQLEAFLVYDSTLGRSTIVRQQIFHANAQNT